MKTVRTFASLTAFAAIAACAFLPTSVMAMGADYTVDIPLESYSLNKRYQLFVDLDGTGAEGTMSAGEQVVAGEVYGRMILSNGDYHSRTGLPHGESYSIHISAQTQQDEILFDDLVELDEQGRFSQALTVPEDTVVYVSATMVGFAHSIRTMESQTFLGTSVDESYVVLDDGAQIVLEMMGDVSASYYGSDFSTATPIRCTASPELGRWTNASCDGLHRFGFEDADGDNQWNRLEVGVVGELNEQGQASGQIVLRLRPLNTDVGCLWRYWGAPEANRWDTAWSGTADEYGVVQADVQEKTVTMRKVRYECQGFLGYYSPKPRMANRFYTFQVSSSSELEVTFR